MTWGRLHDGASRDDKLLALTDAAWRMWGNGLIYCQDKLSDGFIPEHVIHTFGIRAKNKEKVADELCRVLVPGKGPLWHRVEGGYRVHDYHDWNPSKDQILEGRRQAQDRMRRRRTDRQSDVGGSPACSREHTTEQPREHGRCSRVVTALHSGRALPRTTYHEKARTAPLVASPSHATVEHLWKTRARHPRSLEPNGDNFWAIVRVAREQLATGDVEDERDLQHATKHACLRLGIAYGLENRAGVSALVRACASAWKTQQRLLERAS